MCGNANPTTPDPKGPQDLLISNPNVYVIPVKTHDALRRRVSEQLVQVMEARGTTAAGEESGSVALTEDGSLYAAAAVPGTDGTSHASVLGVTRTANVIGINAMIPQTLNEDGALDAVKVTLDVNSGVDPLAGPIVLTFDVNGSGASISRIDVPKDAVTGLSAGQVWCIARAGGTSILQQLVAALPSLAAGPQAYGAAVLARVPEALVRTAQTVIDQCF